MTNNQLRLLARIEKLLFEKKDYSFEEILKEAKKSCFRTIQNRDMGTAQATARLLRIDKDTVNRVVLCAGVCIH